jgi:hypothetical protein
MRAPSQPRPVFEPRNILDEAASLKHFTSHPRHRSTAPRGVMRTLLMQGTQRRPDHDVAAPPVLLLSECLADQPCRIVVPNAQLGGLALRVDQVGGVLEVLIDLLQPVDPELDQFDRVRVVVLLRGGEP